MKKKILAAVLTGILAVGSLTACGADKGAGSSENGENADKLTTITVAASATPHAEILEQAKPILLEQGYDLQIVFSN